MKLANPGDVIISPRPLVPNLPGSLCDAGQEVPETFWHAGEYRALDVLSVPGVEDAERDDGDADGRENEREHDRVLEDLPRQVPDVPEHPQRTENDEHPPLQEHGEHDKREVDEPVE